MNLTQISAAAVFYSSVIVLGLFALPSFIGSLKQAGIFRGFLAFLLLAGIILGFETIAVKTGLPYGKFSYGTVMGRKLFGATPWIVMLVYPPIVIGCFWLARKISEGFLNIVFTSVFVTSIYLIMAPVFTKLSLFYWEAEGQILNVPARAFIGWFVCALVSSIFLSIVWGSAEIRKLSAYSLFSILLFWSGANLGVGYYISGGIGVAVCLMLLVLFATEKNQSKLTD